MGLFDGQPLTRDEMIRVELARGFREGQTIRKVLSNGKPYTARRKPYYLSIGPGPTGATCATCQALRRLTTRADKVYFKCGLAQVTAGAGSDIGAKDPACAQYVERWLVEVATTRPTPAPRPGPINDLEMERAISLE